MYDESMMDDLDLFKARGPHKYVKRTGSPGNYRYWYKMPDGTLAAHEPDSKGHHGAKREHARRLILGHVHGVHTKSKAEMAAEVGLPVRKFEEIISNLAAAARRKGRSGSREDVLRQKDIEEAELQEAAGAAEQETPAPSVEAPADTSMTEAERADAILDAYGRSSVEGDALATRYGMTRQEATRKHSPDRYYRLHMKEFDEFGPELSAAAGSIEAIPGLTDGERRFLDFWNGRNGVSIKVKDGRILINSDKFPSAFKQKHKEFGLRGRIEMLGRTDGKYGFSDPGSEDDMASLIQVLTENPDAASTPAAETPAAPARRGRGRPRGSRNRRPQEEAPADRDLKIKDLLEKLKKEHGLNLEESSTRSNLERVRRAREAAKADNAPNSPASQALQEGDPVMQRSEQHVQEMIETAAEGGNPYLDKAKEIFNRIQNELKPERKQTISHALSAIEKVNRSGQPMTQAAFLAAYKEVSGKSVRSINPIAQDFERGTFYTLDEVMSNAPLNLEVERMKRGYAARQFARLKPFLKNSFTSANPSAPPPYPTFGDIKSWGEHGGTKPEWSGTTRTAVPKEVFDSAVKNAEGKPQYPPSWWPVHLMPVWNYVVKKSQSEGVNPYQTQAIDFSQQGFGVGTQAQYQEGIAKAAIRKYVVMRGGAENLIDIPASKLAEMGTSHSEIFKAKSNDLHHVLRNKIIDAPSLVPFIDEAIEEAQAMVAKKSVSLVVKLDEPILKAYSNKILKKSLIQKIQRLRNERRSKLSSL